MERAVRWPATLVCTSVAHAANWASTSEDAEATVLCLRANVPHDVPGIAFLSGGQSSEEATEHLNLMNKMGDFPWELSFSYGRALQAAPLNVWQGEERNFDAAQATFIKRARLNSLAHQGKYSVDMEAE